MNFFNYDCITSISQLRQDVKTLRNDNQTIIRLLQLILKGEQIMSVELDALIAQVAKNTEVEASAVVMIKNLADQIGAAKDDPAKLAALSVQLHDSADALAAAIAANTPAAPVVVVAPSV